MVKSVINALRTLFIKSMKNIVNILILTAIIWVQIDALNVDKGFIRIFKGDVCNYPRTVIVLGLMECVRTVIKDSKLWMEFVWDFLPIVELLDQMEFVSIVTKVIKYQQQDA